MDEDWKKQIQGLLDVQVLSMVRKIYIVLGALTCEVVLQDNERDQIRRNIAYLD